MKSKRTPGPWKICRRQRVGPNHTRYTVLCIGYEGEYRAFSVAELGRADDPEVRANARFICKAANESSQ